MPEDFSSCEQKENCTYPRLHVCVEQRFPHESHAADKTFVRFFVAVNESVGISVVPAVEGLAANLKGIIDRLR